MQDDSFIQKTDIPRDKRILIVDDDFTSTRILKKYFDKKGYYAVTSDSALLGQEILKEDDFGIVITDINMPDINGLDFLIWIKEKYPSTKIIMITAFVSEAVRELSYQHGAQKYFPKPLNVLDLEAYVKQVSEQNDIGRADKTNIFDFLKIISLAKDKRIVSIIDLDNDLEAKIYINGDFVLHAEIGDIVGKEAFYKILNLKKTEIENSIWVEPPITTINHKISFLLNSIDLIEKEVSINKLEKLVDNLTKKPEEKNYPLEKKILIVDDDFTSTRILSKYLQKKGYYVVTKNSAIDAEKSMEVDRFGLVITDINMPKVSGLELLLWIEENYPETKVIMMTAFSSEKIKEFVNSHGALKFFEKPINLVELEKFIIKITKPENKQNKAGNFNLLDFIQMNSLSKRKKVISVLDNITRKMGTIILKDNKILEADFFELKGKEAFNHMINLESVHFSVANLEENSLKIPETKNINHPEKDESNSKIIDFLDIKPNRLNKLINQTKKSNIDQKKNESYDIEKKVLIVDDDFTSTRILKSFFDKKNFYAVTTNSAISGKEILKQETFGLVITDINMPKVNGLEFLLWIKENFPRTKVIVITSTSSEELSKFSNERAAFKYFEKPISKRKLDNMFNNLNFENKEIELIDFIKVLAFTKKEKLISIVSLLDENKKGFIYLKKGKILQAKFEDFTSYKALSVILKMKGFFNNIDWIEPEKYEIDEKLDIAISKAESYIFSEKIAEIAFETNEINDLINKNFEDETKLKEIDKDFTIYESGSFLGIKIGETAKSEVINLLKKYSEEFVSNQTRNRVLIYQDISLSILFDDNNIVEEVTFGEKYKGQTSKGVKLKDKVQKGIDIYGKPKICTVKGALWDKISLYSLDGIYISSIKLRK